MRLDDPLDAAQLAEVARLFDALGHPVRLRIVCGLLDGSCCVGDMVDCLDLPQAFVSRHLAVLRDAGVLESAVEGRNRVYRVIHPLVPPLVALLRRHTTGEAA
jgi:DNA-binding transcriptional ArsR family regulator